MSDTLKILMSSTGHSLSKGLIGESDVPNKFYPGITFTASEVIVKNLYSLTDLLRSLEAEPTKTIIRGSSISDTIGLVNCSKELFKPAKHQWCMIDIDRLPKSDKNGAPMRRRNPKLGTILAAHVKISW